MILFVGEKPSSKNTDPNVAFLGTKSYDTVQKWLQLMDINTMFTFVNRIDKKFERELRKAILNRYPVVALGREAERTINKKFKANPLLDITSFGLVHALPHPSGRNRKLNDKKYVNKVLNKCKEFLDNLIK